MAAVRRGYPSPGMNAGAFRRISGKQVMDVVKMDCYLGILFSCHSIFLRSLLLKLQLFVELVVFRRAYLKDQPYYTMGSKWRFDNQSSVIAPLQGSGRMREVIKA